VTNLEDAPLPEFDPAAVVDLDVRADIAAGREPLPAIMRAVQTMPPGSVLHLRAPFRPTPLLQRLAQLGFASHATAFADDDWSTWFWRADAAPAAPRATENTTTRVPEGILDMRLLPPPEPLLRILELVEASDAPFDVLLPFYPEPLVALLEPSRRRIVLVENRPDGVQVRIEAPTGEG
jgi:uncharacterized protein (DUF2249 family)